MPDLCYTDVTDNLHSLFQAVMKIASQLGEMMRDSSHIWTPPLYRRLLSTDKRERDMTERCLLKIKSIMLPPSLTLSKVLLQLSGVVKSLHLSMCTVTQSADGKLDSS